MRRSLNDSNTDNTGFIRDSAFLAVVFISDEDDWANLGTVGQHLSKRKPDFDTRLFGHKKLSDMIRAYPKWFQIQKGQGKSIQVKTLRK